MPDSNYRESLADFRRWAAQRLEREESAPSSPSDEELFLRLKNLGPVVHARPREQSIGVNDIAQRMFAAYQVDNGKMHLGGCQLTDIPFLRLTFLAPDNPNEVRHIFVSHDGSSVEDSLVVDLGLNAVEPLLKAPPRIDEAALNALIAAGRRVAAKAASARDPQAVTVDPLASTLVWVKQVNGQLHFTISEATASLPFSGWARTIQPKAFVGQYSGASTFHLSTTHDGRIDAAEQIASCEVSGERHLLAELVRCSVTGKRVKKELTTPCPVTGQPALVDEFATCPHCRQQVSKTALQGSACAACEDLHKIKKDDPRLVWILGEHAGLDRWRNWQMAETLEVYIAQASSLWKRLLVVVDKETLVVRYLATAGRFSNQWSEVLQEHRGELLGS